MIYLYSSCFLYRKTLLRNWAALCWYPWHPVGNRCHTNTRGNGFSYSLPRKPKQNAYQPCVPTSQTHLLARMTTGDKAQHRYLIKLAAQASSNHRHRMAPPPSKRSPDRPAVFSSPQTSTGVCQYSPDPWDGSGHTERDHKDLVPLTSIMGPLPTGA